MNTGDFTEFTTALAAFESGIDTTQPQTQASLQYLRVFDPQYGNVDPATVDFNNPSDLADLQYHVHNTLGFLGKYQFGEPLLIDLGYYTPAPTGYYGTTATNEWKGEWTGKNGVYSKEDFMSNVQELAIREAFDMNMGVINQYLGQAGKSIDDFIGQEFTYTRLGETHVASVTMSGILSSAHLQGPGGVAQLLLHNVASSDEYGTNILFYMDKFAGYSSPYGTDANDVLVGSDYSESFAGEGGENIITTGGGQDKIVLANKPNTHDTITDFDINHDVISLSNFPGVTFADLAIGSAHGGSLLTFPTGQTLTLSNVNASDLSASQFVYGPYTIGWNANSGDTIIDNFNITHDLIDLNYAFTSGALDLYEEQGSTVIEVVDNNQRVILEGVAIADLSAAQFIKAPIDFASVHFGVNSDYTPPNNTDTTDHDSSQDTPVVTDNDTSQGSGQGSAQGTASGDTFSYTWNWGARDVIEGFNVADDRVDLQNLWTSFDQISVYDNAEGSAVIDLLNLNNQTITLQGVSTAELSADNFSGVTGTWQPSSDQLEPEPPVIADDIDTDTDTDTENDVDDSPVIDTPPVDTDSAASSGGSDYSYTWNWGANEVIDNFDVTQDSVDLQGFWTSYDEFSVISNPEGDAVIDLSAINNQTITLKGVAMDSLSADNFSGVAGSFSALNLTEGSDVVNTEDVVTPPVTPETSDDAPELDLIEHDVNETNLVSTDHVQDVFNFTWSWGSTKTITGFDVTQDVVDLTRFWTSSDQVNIYDNTSGDAVIDLTNLNNQTITLLGVSSSELNDDNVII